MKPRDHEGKGKDLRYRKLLDRGDKGQHPIDEQWLIEELDEFYDDKLKPKFKKLESEIYSASEAGTLTTLGGAAIEKFDCYGAKAGQLVFPVIKTEGTTVSIKTAKVEKNKISIEFSADPGADVEIAYLLR